MKRPQSAKQVRNYWAGPSHDQSYHGESRLTKNSKVKLLNFVSTSNDMSRMLPKNIKHDKERLYYQNLQAKTSLNEMQEENVKLKTRIAILEKEKERMSRLEEVGGRSKAGISGPIHEKQNMAVLNLKKMVREGKQELQNAKSELVKLKKTIRYTKLNQLQIQTQTLIAENKRQSRILIQLQAELQAKIQEHDTIDELEKIIKIKEEEIKEVAEINLQMEQIIVEEQTKNKQLTETLTNTEKKYQKQMASLKRKVDILTRNNQNLKTDNKVFESRLEQEKKRQSNRNVQRPVRPTSSHPYSNSSAQNNQNNRSLNPIAKQKEAALQLNQKLKKELEEAKQQLADSESHLKDKFYDNTLNYSCEPFQLVLTKQENQGFGVKGKRNSSKREEKKEKIKQVVELNQQSKIKQQNVQLSPILEQVRGILTYRMKYNRYTYQELRQDIIASDTNVFSLSDLRTMLTDEPFFLTRTHANEFIKTCHDNQDLSGNGQVATQVLLERLRMVIDDFQLVEEQQQEQMLYKIADFMTRERKQLQGQFKKYNSQYVTKDQLVKTLQKWTQLNSAEIDLAVCYIAVGSQSLEKLNFIEMLDKFTNQLSVKGSREIQNIEEDELSFGENEMIPCVDEEFQDEII